MYDSFPLPPICYRRIKQFSLSSRYFVEAMHLFSILELTIAPHPNPLPQGEG